MVARLPQAYSHGFARLLRLPPQLATDSSCSLDDNNTASEASNVGVFPQSVCRSFRVVRSIQTEGAGVRQPPAQAAGAGHRLPPTCVAESLLEDPSTGLT